MQSPLLIVNPSISTSLCVHIHHTHTHTLIHTNKHTPGVHQRVIVNQMKICSLWCKIFEIHTNESVFKKLSENEPWKLCSESNNVCTKTNLHFNSIFCISEVCLFDIFYHFSPQNFEPYSHTTYGNFLFSWLVANSRELLWAHIPQLLCLETGSGTHAATGTSPLRTGCLILQAFLFSHQTLSSNLH